jgi:hypothetical protein
VQRHFIHRVDQPPKFWALEEELAKKWYIRDVRKLCTWNLKTNDGLLQSWDGKLIQEAIDFLGWLKLNIGQPAIDESMQSLARRLISSSNGLILFQFLSTLSQNVNYLKETTSPMRVLGQLSNFDFDNILLGGTPSKESLHSMFGASLEDIANNFFLGDKICESCLHFTFGRFKKMVPKTIT